MDTIRRIGLVLGWAALSVMLGFIVSLLWTLLVMLLARHLLDWVQAFFGNLR